MSVVGQFHPEIGIEVPEGQGGPAPRYDSLEARADTIHALILDGTLDPEDGLWLLICESPRIAEVERARRDADARSIRKRFSIEMREQALALVAGGASFRVAAAAALGDERYRMNVWRWARARDGVK